MTLFARYAKANDAKRTQVDLRAEAPADPLEGASADEAPVVAEMVQQETAEPAAPVAEDQFVEQSEQIDRTHAMIRSRSGINVSADASEGITITGNTFITQAGESAFESLTSEEIPVSQEEAPVAQVEDEIVENPVEVVPEGEPVPEEPILDVTADADGEDVEIVTDSETAAEPDAVVIEPGEEVAPEVEVVDAEVVPEVAPEVAVDVSDEIVVPTEDSVVPVEEPVLDVAVDPVVEAPLVEPIADEPTVVEPVVEEPIVDVDTVVPEEVPSEEPAVVDAPAEDAIPEVEPVAETTDEVAVDDNVVVTEPEAAPEPEVVAEPEAEPVVEPEAPVVDDTDAPGEDVVTGDEIAPSDFVIDEDEDDIIVDTPLEGAPDEASIEDDYDFIEEEEALAASMSQEIDQITQSMIAIETFGIHPSTVAVMHATNLLNGTSIQSLGLEAFGIESTCGPDSQMALEALGDKLKETAAKWAGKILSFAESAGEKVMSVLNPLWEKISGAASKLTSYTWDKVAIAGRVVKAHPYKTIIGVIAAIATVAGIVAFAGTGLPVFGVKAKQMASFVNALKGKIDAINWPFGKIATAISENGIKLGVQVKNVATNAKAIAMGSLDWTQSAVGSCAQRLGRAWDATKTASTSIASRGGKIAKAAGNIYNDSVKVAGAAAMKIGERVTLHTGNGYVGTGATVLTAWMFGDAIGKIFIGIIKLLFGVVAVGFRVIAATLNALVGGSRPAAA